MVLDAGPAVIKAISCERVVLMPVTRSAARCWELDALDPNELRNCVEQAIWRTIEPTAWERCKVVERAEQQSLRSILTGWGQ